MMVLPVDQRYLGIDGANAAHDRKSAKASANYDYARFSGIF
jgi:hypothetical protein